MLHCQLCSIAVQINNCLKRTSSIKVATMKFLLRMEAITCLYTTKLTLFVMCKDEWEALVSP